jgi:DNA repair protein SbcD/Mre11
MRATFVHTADNHLGYEQYGLKERFNDFARAFLAVVDAAVAQRADCFIIAGDLFNKRAIDALTLMQAQEGLQRLQAAGIPAIAIEGNHDRSYYRDGVSWLQFLCWQKLLILLNPLVEDGVPRLTPWDAEAMRGAYYDLTGASGSATGGERLRVYGLPWYGTSTARVMENFAGELAAAREREQAEGVTYRVLMMHTGVEGIVPQMHGLPAYEQFQPLRGLVDYVALGHIHKQYVRDEWLYNPGSTETWGAEESAWERGYYVARVATDAPAGEPRHSVEHVINPRRPFIRHMLRVDGVVDPTALYERLDVKAAGWVREDAEKLAAAPLEPVIDLSLTGVLGFDQGAYDKARLEEIVRQYYDALTVRIHDGTRDTEWDVGEEEGGDGRDRSTWQQLEVHIFQELIARDARYTAQAPQWAKVLSDLKTMALAGDEPSGIARRLREARAELAN